MVTLLIVALPPVLYLLPGCVLLAFSLRSWRMALVNIILLVLGAFLVAGFRIHLPNHRFATVRVMSFNVQHGVKGIEKVAGVIRKYDPDVVCIQEANDSVEHGLRAFLPGYWIVRSESLIVLSKMPFEGTRTWPPITGKLRPVQRVALSGFFVYNVHLDPSKIDEHLTGGLFEHLANYDSLQSREFDEISRALVDEPLVLCGDFNGSPAGLRYERLTHRLGDAFNQAGNGYGCTIPAEVPFRRIDWILVSRHWHVLRSFVPSEIASDHRPTVADLEFAAGYTHLP